MLGFGAHRIHLHQSLADAVLNAVEQIHVETVRQARKEFAKSPRHLIKCTGSRRADQWMSVGWQQKKRNDQPGDASERDLHDAIKRRSDLISRGSLSEPRTMMAVMGAAEIGIYRRDKGKRAQSEGENREQRDFARMRDQHADGAAVDGAAQRSREISNVAFSDRPTLICVTMTAVNTAHNGRGSCSNCASARATSAAIVTLIESANCTRR